MKEIYTSHWGSRELPHLDATMVAISRGKPRWRLPFRYRVLGLLAPSREAFALKDHSEFEAAYLAGLEEVGAETILAALERISRENGGRPLVLLCWEKPGEPCHRRLAAAWLEERTGQEVAELKTGMIEESTPGGQTALF